MIVILEVSLDQGRDIEKVGINVRRPTIYSRVMNIVDLNIGLDTSSNIEIKKARKQVGLRIRPTKFVAIKFDKKTSISSMTFWSNDQQAILFTFP